MTELTMLERPPLHSGTEELQWHVQRHFKLFDDQQIPLDNGSNSPTEKRMHLSVILHDVYAFAERGRTVKGKKLPPVCKKMNLYCMGDVIKEGQAIGYIDRFGNILPVKSDVAGEVLKFLFEEGEAVGYGDPIVAVLPSFHGLN